jgi:hypothetical protein
LSVQLRGVASFEDLPVLRAIMPPVDLDDRRCCFGDQVHLKHRA